MFHEKLSIELHRTVRLEMILQHCGCSSINPQLHKLLCCFDCMVICLLLILCSLIKLCTNTGKHGWNNSVQMLHLCCKTATKELQIWKCLQTKTIYKSANLFKTWFPDTKTANHSLQKLLRCYICLSKLQIINSKTVSWQICKCLQTKTIYKCANVSKPDLLTPKLQIIHYKNLFCATKLAKC